MPRKAKFTFVLKVDAHLVNTKYGFDLVSNIGVNDKLDENLTTAIDDLPVAKDLENHTYSFLDESKQSHSCLVTMKDLLTGSQLPKTTDIYCFWCKCNFDTTPIGCPVEFVADKVTKIYHSEITKDKYKITENLTTKRKQAIEKLMGNHKSKFEILDNHDRYFIIDGIYCSFNCCMAFIKENQQKDFYRQSEALLYTMYKQTFNKAAVKIECAPHWRLLSKYGGPLTTGEFHKAFNTMQFVDIDDFIIRAPQCRMIGKLYEKKVKF